MKYAIIAAIAALAVLCAQPNPARAPEPAIGNDFTVAVAAEPGQSLKADKPIAIAAVLMNNTGKIVKIMHASPLVQVQIYDDRNNPLVSFFATDDVGITRELKPGEAYNADGITYGGGKRTIRVKQPGTYRLVGTASFSVELDDGTSKQLRIVSEPAEIAVEGGA